MGDTSVGVTGRSEYSEADDEKDKLLEGSLGVVMYGVVGLAWGRWVVRC